MCIDFIASEFFKWNLGWCGKKSQLAQVFQWNLGRCGKGTSSFSLWQVREDVILRTCYSKKKKLEIKASYFGVAKGN